MITPEELRNHINVLKKAMEFYLSTNDHALLAVLSLAQQDMELAAKQIEHKHNYVQMPTNEDEAAGMVLIGEAWLRYNAPHRLKNG